MAKTKSNELISAETEFNLSLGGKIYTLRFGTKTFMRIKEENPHLTTVFHVVEEMALYEAIPALIHAAIKPEDRDWSSKDELIDLYDECEDQAISKVIPAYLSAAGLLSKKLSPALDAIAALQKGKG